MSLEEGLAPSKTLTTQCICFGLTVSEFRYRYCYIRIGVQGTEQPLVRNDKCWTGKASTIQTWVSRQNFRGLLIGMTANEIRLDAG